ncbi:hypothetical protein APTSU1_001828100 [Apodemus speciosus]|uniref:Peptidase S1 domain-containing protein n=1 Tax=Apodemus speciosus TaxID=105296 RepID=A0ABQ0FV60_APOSI
MKPLHLDISGVNDPESIPQGQRICLYPKFNPNNENDPVKADIGLVILEEPISGDEIPLSQSTNISLKSCSKCQYRSCYVYEYQKVQRASPVLCLLKNRWELVGLIHKTSRICQNPTVIIRTTPYFSWIKRFIKASKKLLNPTSSLRCRTLYENEHVPQIRHSHNYFPTLASHNSSLRVFQGIGISPQTQNTNNVRKIFNFSDLNYFPDSHRLFLDKSQTPQPVKPLPIAGLPGNSGQNLIQYYQNTPPHNTGNLSKSDTTISDTTISYTFPKTDGAKPWGFAAYNTDESFDNIMADIIKQSNPSEDNEVEPENFHEDRTTDDSWMENTNDLEKYLDLLRVMSNGPQNQYTTKANLPPSFPLSAGEGPRGLSTTSAAVNKTDLPMRSLLQNETFNMPSFENRRIPKPSSIIELWSSPSDYYVVSSQDQLATDSTRAQNHPVTDANRFQILPVASIGIPSTSKFTYESLPIDLEAKTPPYPN